MSARMITVVHVITKLELGGAQENTLDTCARLDRARFRVALVFGPGGPLDTRAKAIENLRLEPIPALGRDISPLDDARALRTLIRAIERLRAEHERLGYERHAFIVHTHSSKAGILGRFAAYFAGVPNIVHSIHGFGFFEGQAPLAFGLFVAAERAAARVTDAFVSVSRASLAEAQARGIVGPAHISRVLRSGFDLGPFITARDRRVEARRKLGLQDDDAVIVAIANLKPQKDPLTLVAAMRQVVSVRPGAICLYAGDGPLRSETEVAIRAAGLEAHMRLLGWRQDVPDLLAASDVVVLASIFEGLPRSAVQALAVGRPFVGTRVDGTSEVIRDGKNGFLVPPRDPSRLARGILAALETRPVDPEDQARILAFDVHRMVREEAELYEALIARAPMRRPQPRRSS